MRGTKNGWTLLLLMLTRNVNGYAEFTVEAGPYLKYGADNLLKVIADNSLEPNSRWYTGSGIYRPVRLLVGNKVYLPQDTVRITTREVGESFALLDVTAQVQSASAATERVTLQQTICREGMAVLTDRQNLLLQPGKFLPHQQTALLQRLIGPQSKTHLGAAGHGAEGILISKITGIEPNRHGQEPLSSTEYFRR